MNAPVPPAFTSLAEGRVMHAFGEEIIMHLDSGFDRYFARCAEEFAKGGEPDMPRIVAISAEHGIHFAT